MPKCGDFAIDAVKNRLTAGTQVTANDRPHRRHRNALDLPLYSPKKMRIQSVTYRQGRITTQTYESGISGTIRVGVSNISVVLESFATAANAVFESVSTACRKICTEFSPAEIRTNKFAWRRGSRRRVDGTWLWPGPARAAHAEIRSQDPSSDGLAGALSLRTCDPTAPGGGALSIGIRDRTRQASVSIVELWGSNANNSRSALIFPVSVVIGPLNFDDTRRSRTDASIISTPH